MIDWEIFFTIVSAALAVVFVMAIVVIIKERFFKRSPAAPTGTPTPTPTLEPSPISNDHKHTIPGVVEPEPRCTLGKFFVNVGLFFMIFGLLYYLVSRSATSFGLERHYWATVIGISAIAWLAIAISTGMLHACFVSLKENTGAVSVSFLTGFKRIYGPGLHIKYIWEDIELENIQSLEHRVVDLKYEFDLREAGKMQFDGSVLFTPRLEWLLHLIHFDKDAFARSFKDRFLESAAREFQKYNHDQAIGNQNEIEKAIREKFEQLKEKDVGFQMKFGGECSELHFKTNLDAETQKARMQRVDTETFAEAANKLSESKANKETLEALLTHQGKAKMNIIRGLEGLENIPAALVAMTPALASLANAQKELVGGTQTHNENKPKQKGK